VAGGVFSGENLWSAIKIGIAFLILSAIGVAFMGGNVSKYIIGFPVVYILAWLSHVIAGYTKARGLNAFSTFGCPRFPRLAP
jgi:hypothetical protein